MQIVESGRQKSLTTASQTRQLILHLPTQLLLATGSFTPLCAKTRPAHFCQQDTLILGSVGSNSWLGSLQEIHEEKQTQIEDPLMKNDSYMGTEHKVISDYLLLYLNFN